MIQDQIGRTLTFETTPQRVVSLVPSLTELICDMGLQSALVGMTKFCVHPADIKGEAQIIGGTKNPHIDKILALKPDLIIANREENREEDIATLEQSCNVYVSDINNISDSFELISSLGTVFKKEEEAREIRARLEKTTAQIAAISKSIEPQRILYLIWQKPFMAAGTDTYISRMLELFGFKNAVSQFGNKSTRYPELSQDEIEAINPDMIFLSSEPYPFKAEHCGDFFARFNTKTILVDGELFSWYGTRLLKCFPSVTAIEADIHDIFR